MRNKLVIYYVLSLVMAMPVSLDKQMPKFSAKSILFVIFTGYQRSKHLSRLFGLHEAIKVEAPEISVLLPEFYASGVPKRTLSDELLYRPALANLMKGVNFINKSVGLHVLEIKFPIPFINYASLIYDPRGLKMDNLSQTFVSNKLTSISKIVGSKKIAFEVIDSHSLITGTRDLIGILRMKLRLMNQCGWTVHSIFEDDLSRLNCDEKTMAAFIIDTLSKIKI